MPHGITQEQVDTAADGLLQAGERPTVEKVRATLGTGSPNTITRMLDTWRLGLAERLKAVNALPSLPDDVSQAMTALWGQAVQHAREHTQQEIEAERDALQQSRSAMDAREAGYAAMLATAQANTQRAEEAARRSEAEITVLQRLAERLEAEGKDHAQERDRLLAQNQALEAACAKLRDEIRAIVQKSEKERSAREEHVRSVEDRAHTQVDRARTELKAAHGELADARKRHQQEAQALQRTSAELTRSLAAAEREAAHQRGVAEALKLRLPTAGHGKATGRQAARGRNANTRVTSAGNLAASPSHAKRRKP